jgi:hypothetical protein
MSCLQALPDTVLTRPLAAPHSKPSLEIHGRHVFADRSAKFRGLNVFGVDRVGLQSCLVLEDGYEAGMVGAGQFQDIKAYGEALNRGNRCCETTKEIDMCCPHFRLNVVAILPDDNMGKHYPRIKDEG